ncbi:MAG: ORF6N domain-containing protein [Nitrospirota bacterium]
MWWYYGSKVWERLTVNPILIPIPCLAKEKQDILSEIEEAGLEKHDSLVPIEFIDNKILFIRGHKVMLDADLADIYGVSTKCLNEQMKRNLDRFPEDFMFQLTKEGKAEVVANCNHLKKLKFSPALPYAFTEHGAIMLASVLNSAVAVRASIQIVRAFVRLREIISSSKELAKRLDDLEKKYDSQFKVVFDAIRQLMTPPEIRKKKIGFRRDSEG